VGGEAHTLSFHVIDGEPELGMASHDWRRMSDIDAAIRATIAVNAAYRAAWRDLDTARRAEVRARGQAQAAAEERRRGTPGSLRRKPHRTIEGVLRLKPSRLRRYQEAEARVIATGLLLQQAAVDYLAEARAFIQTAFQHHGPQIGDILADLAPRQTAAPHHA